jgi:hypothetical protein
MFRAAAEELDPSGSRITPSPSSVRAQVVVYWVREQRRWLDAALAGLGSAGLRAGGAPAAWLEAACRAWISHADRSIRALTEQIMGQLGDGPSTVPARLIYWRTTGLRWVLDEALEMTPTDVLEGDAVGAAAAWGAYTATAREDFATAARRGFGGSLAEVPAALWPTAAEALDIEVEDVSGEAIDALEEADPGDRLVAAAALVAPVIRLGVEWSVASELREGPIAEAATFPWPALRLSFFTMDRRDQIHIHPTLDREPWKVIEDLGVVAAGIQQLVDEADRSALMEGMGRRKKRSLLRRK